jgi:hypothetical protein
VIIAPESHAIDALRMMSDGGSVICPSSRMEKFGASSRGDFKGMERDWLDQEEHLWECIR